MISVVIPARDAADAIGQQLEALAQQSFLGSWEIIVVDDGSRDETAAVVRRWQSKLPNLNLVRQSRLGSSSARNLGIAHAKGDFVAFCDSDDVVEPGWLEGMSQGARDADLVAGVLDVERLNSETVVTWRGRPENPSLRYLDFLPVAAGANLGVWKDALVSVEGWNPEFRSHDDAELTWRLQVRGYRFGFSPDAVVNYRYRSTLGSMAVQHLRWGVQQVHLFCAFRAHGLPRRPLRRALREDLALAAELPRVLLGRRSRGRWVSDVALATGRILGSIRYLTVYL